MTEILFYHLEAQPLEKVLPKLVEKSLERDWTVVIETASEERAEAIDSLLWTWSDESFLPHARAGGDADHLQPVLITTRPHNPNDAEIRFFTDRAVPTPAAVGPYQRIVYLFSGHDPDAVTEARSAWRDLKQAGHTLTYWQQDQGGRWVKKA